MRRWVDADAAFGPRRQRLWPRWALPFVNNSAPGLGLPPPPLAGEGWGGGGMQGRVSLCAPTLALPRKRGRERTERAAITAYRRLTPARQARSSPTHPTAGRCESRR